ncbi:hypothetical protein R1flu_027309 [Riccia fluitans]|uniref:Uncharacterized protein n=1 Tax=Riccia fluitans TaxID=41844 RepID=A0ABD1XII4_9MARC
MRSREASTASPARWHRRQQREARKRPEKSRITAARRERESRRRLSLGPLRRFLRGGSPIQGLHSCAGDETSGGLRVQLWIPLLLLLSLGVTRRRLGGISIFFLTWFGFPELRRSMETKNKNMNDCGRWFRSALECCRAGKLSVGVAEKLSVNDCRILDGRRLARRKNEET